MLHGFDIYPTVSACLVTGNLNCRLWWLSHSADLLAWHLADCDDFFSCSTVWLAWAYLADSDDGLWWLLLPISWLVGVAFGRLEWLLSSFSSFGMLRWPVFLYSTSLSVRGNWSPLPTRVRLCTATARPTLPIPTRACNIFSVSKQMGSLPVLAIVKASTAVDACSCMCIHVSLFGSSANTLGETALIVDSGREITRCTGGQTDISTAPGFPPGAGCPTPCCSL